LIFPTLSVGVPWLASFTNRVTSNQAVGQSPGSRQRREKTNSKQLYRAYAFFKVKLNSLPLPNWLRTLTFPPCASMICLTIESPSPVPPNSLDRPLSTVKNLSKMRGKSFRGIPIVDCGLKIEPKDVKDKFWELVYELYIRTNNFVSTRASKCIESKDHSFVAGIMEQKK